MIRGVRHCSAAAALAGLLWTLSASADEGSDHQYMGGNAATEFVLFASSEAHYFTATASNTELNEDANFIGDAILAINRGRFRVFGEFQLSDEEHDLERFKVGFEPVADTVIWFGRFHQPASAWNTEHHHGRYLQTAVTRPSVELWEDEDGVIPQHISGLYVESRRQIGQGAGLQLSAGAGWGVSIARNGLEPVDLLNLHLADHRLSLTGRIAYLPSYVGTNAVGLLLARNEMPVTDAVTTAALQSNDVRQDVFGAFANWDSGHWRIRSAVYDVQLNLTGIGSSHSENFAAGYIQVERMLRHHLAAYARQEGSIAADRSRFIRVNHPDFELRRSTLGLRWDFWRHQALTAEVGHGETVRSREFEYRLQWSAAIP